MTRTLKDRYELGPMIGAGGTAKVYASRDRLLDRQVAVKVLDDAQAASADPAGRERFLQEAQSAARFTHPHAVAVYDAGQDDGSLFIVMELIEGPTLAERIAEQAPLTEPDIVRIGTQLLAALGAAHSVGLVHRDVKPANVLLDAAGNARLADFGIAKRFDELSDSLTAEGMVIGTLNYLAPEQAAGQVVTPAADLYAVGVVLYEMSTGSRPLPTAHRLAVGAPGSPAAMAAMAATDPRSRRPELSSPIATTISRALAVAPTDRFASAEAMSAALRGEMNPTLVLPAVAAGPVTAAGSGPVTTSGATRVLPASMAPTEPMSRPGRSWTVAVVALVVSGGFVMALALRDDDQFDSAAALDGLTAGSSLPPAGTASPVTSVAPTLPTTVAPTTVPVTTVAPTTVAPADEVVPGFPVTDDPEQFVAQLLADRSIAGRNTKQLVEGIRKLIDADNRTYDDVDKLAGDIEDWVDDRRLDPFIAAAALDLIAALPVSDGDGDDD